MLIIASFIIVVGSIPMAALFATWGIDWMYIGYGLNPWIAFPLSCLCLANFYIHGKILLLDFRTFCMDQENMCMREYLRLHQQVTNKL